MSTHFFKISLCYDKKWEIKLCISVNIYRRLPKLGMSTHVFKISLCYDKQETIGLMAQLMKLCQQKASRKLKTADTTIKRNFGKNE